MANTLKLLSQCYESVMNLAEQQKIRSIAFPALGAGTNKIPHPLAAHQALEILQEYTERFDRLVICLNSDESLKSWLDTQRKFFPQ
ncbi:putative phosphatase [gamma proteobacterium IMCC2047]|nr:putative phosphatase [gamma proteobacterium IMCC2047]